MQKLSSSILKQLLFIALVVSTTNCVAQEKIILTTGDTILGTLSKVDYDHTRITKPDGTSLLILTNMIKKQEYDKSALQNIGNDSTMSASSKMDNKKLFIGMHIGPGGSILLENAEFSFGIIRPRFNFIAGFRLNYMLTKKITLCVETNYETKGFRLILHDVSFFDPNGTSPGPYIGTTRTVYMADFITIPVMAKFNFAKKKISWFGSVGIFAAYHIRSGIRDYPIHGALGVAEYYYSGNNHIIRPGLVTSLGASFYTKEKLQFTTEIRQNTQINSIKNTWSAYETLTLLFGISYKLK